MNGIYPMAALTLVVGALSALAYLAAASGRGKSYWPLLLFGLPLSFLVNRLVKGPLIKGIMTWSGVSNALNADSPLWFAALILLNAPLFEETTKLLPFFLPPARRWLSQPQPALWAGMALGMSFGLGEAAYLAYGFAQMPQYQSMPAQLFTGFLTERLMVIFLHGFLTGIAASGLNAGAGRAALRLLTAMSLHALANSGIIFNALGWITPVWVQLPLLLSIGLSIWIFERLRRGFGVNVDGAQPAEKVYF
jgi:uncharacterized membrane protein YhfC